MRFFEFSYMYRFARGRQFYQLEGGKNKIVGPALHEKHQKPFFAEDTKERKWREHYNIICQRFADLGIRKEIEEFEDRILSYVFPDKKNLSLRKQTMPGIPTLTSFE